KTYNNDYTASLLLYHIDSAFAAVGTPVTIYSGKRLISNDADFIVEYDNEKRNFSAMYYTEIDKSSTVLNYVYYENEKLVNKMDYTIQKDFNSLIFYKSTLVEK